MRLGDIRDEYVDALLKGMEDGSLPSMNAEQEEVIRRIAEKIGREEYYRRVQEILLEQQQLFAQAWAYQQQSYSGYAYGFAAPPAPPTDDPYTVLGLPRSATQREISKRYRQLAREFHPDRESGDEAKMKTINAAYNALKEQS